MIPAPFEYVRAGSVEEAVAALARYGDDAKVLAGGHSLLPLMKLRLAAPAVLVDVGRIDALKGVREEGDRIVVGAATTHAAVMKDALVQRHCGVLAHVTAEVGDPQVRHRGTLGGALAHGDAAGDLPACALALDAEFTARGPGGERIIAAIDFFVDYLETALRPDEVLVTVSFPKLGTGWSWNYQKFNRVAQAWAIVGSLAVVARVNGTISQARVGLTNMGSVPIRPSAVEAALAGQGTDAIAAAAARADEGTSPPADLNAQPDYRRHLARVLTRRALERAVGSPD
ncbi:MAG: FAD binding domain-containing protein [Egibacteraceae bacterium]